METIFLFLLSNTFSFYEIQGSAISPIRINGENLIKYERNSIPEELQEAIAGLCNEKNLENGSLSSFVLIENVDPNVNAGFRNALKDKCKGSIPLALIMKTALEQLKKDPSCRIELGGINFDGRNYTISDGCVKESSFNLLGYTIPQDDLMKFLSATIQTSENIIFNH